ncbi:MAG: TIGR02597 family protein, partial [Phycisphaerae bacterium]
MRRIMTTVVVVALLATAVPMFGQVQSVTGYNKVTVPAQSDVIVSVPFTQKPEGTFTVATDGVGDDTLSVDEDITTEYDGAYYIRFTSGDAKGLWSTIKSSNTTTESVELEDTSMLTGGKVAEGDTFKIIKHQMLSSVFPDKLAGLSFVASTGSGFGLKIKTRVLLWQESVGTNQAPSRTFYFHDSGEWRNLAGSNSNDTVIAPDAILVIRNTSDKNLTYIPQGSVYTGAVAKTIQTYASADDVYTSTTRPVAVKLKDLGLGGSDAFVTSTGAGFGLTIKDRLLVFDNSTTGTNKAPVS